ncbi:MAG: hypothetical protein JWQ63_4050 [Mucilaginibacter sp.]|nr:hypothetical protein [Mucilaginibacter sp.]
MKTQSKFTSIILKIAIVITCIIGFGGFTKSDAQSIIGKWHRTGTIAFKIDKVTGKQVPALSAGQQKQFDDAARANEYKESFEFKLDNTYVSKVSAKGMEPREHTEKYSLSGNNLDMNIPLVHNEKTTITIKTLDANTMVWDLLFMGKLTEVIYTRN